MSTDVTSDESKYGFEELDRPTTALSNSSSTFINYIAPRVLGLNLSNSFQGSLRNFALFNSGSSYGTPSPTATTSNHGLVSLIQSSSFSTISQIHSIDGGRAIDEHRELSKLTETLTESILECSNFDAHNRAQELQIEWLHRHANKNSLIIEKMFQAEIQSAQQLIEDAVRHKPDLEKKLNDIHRTTLSNDEYYQQLLAKRNRTSKDIFDYQRQLAQNKAEAEFLRDRIQHFSDEIQFYALKNNSLHGRQVKLRYELDEETFTKQVLQMELEVLESEKISNEDIHLAVIDDVRGSININQISTTQSSTSYREQLTFQVRRMRTEYEKKIDVLRQELHRKFELELHRYQMYKSRPVPTVTKDHEHKLEQTKREKKEIEQQTGSIRGRMNDIENQIKTLEKRINEERNNNQSISSSQRHLAMLEQIIYERERQLNDAIRIRTSLKQQIETRRGEVDQYPKRKIQNSYEIQQTSVYIPPKSILRSSSSSISQEIKSENDQQERPSTPRFIQSITRSSPLESLIITQDEETVAEEGTVIRLADFNVERDYKELNTIFNHSKIDEIAIIQIFCNRSVAQRIQIRDTYKNVFGQNLIDIIHNEIDGNLKKILKLLLFSPIERDCYELRRVLKGTNTDENILIEIFLNCTNKQIKAIIDNYLKLFKSTLEQDINGDRDSYSRGIFLALLQANRPEDDEIDNDEVLEDARKLYETNAKWKIDGSTFIRLLSNRSNTHLKQVFAAYQQFSTVDIEQSIKLDVDADFSRTLMAIVRLVRNRPRFFAYELKKSLKGANTNEDNLNRIIISRSEIDMVQIKSEYEKVAKRTLYDQIQTNTNGNYKRVLLELLRQRIEPPNIDTPMKQFDNSSDLPNKPNINRPTVQWQEPLNKPSLAKYITNQTINERNRNIQFDRNNQAKGNTLLTFNTRPSRSPYIERRPLETTFKKRSYSNDDHK